MNIGKLRVGIVRCILCRGNYDSRQKFKNIKATTVQTSRKTIKDILNHLSKCIKVGVDLLDTSYVCCVCYDKLVEYDKIMVQLLVHQNELSSMLQSSLTAVESSVEMEGTFIKNKRVSDDDSLSSTYDDTGQNEDLSHDQEVTISDGGTMSHNCTQCDKGYSSYIALRKHLTTHASYVQCKICEYTCRDKERLELHMNVHEGKSEYECRYCSKRYSQKSNVIRHMQIHWDKKEFQCETCGLTFSQSNLLYNHKLTHESEETPMVCEQCNQSFKSRKTLNHHRETHREDRPMHPCQICGKKFTEKYSLKVHFKTHNADDAESESSRSNVSTKKRNKKELPCIICNDVFASREILEEHMTNDHDVIVESSIYF